MVYTIRVDYIIKRGGEVMRYEEIKSMTIEELCNELERKNKIILHLSEKNAGLKKKVKVMTESKADALKELLNAMKKSQNLAGKLRQANDDLVVARNRIEELEKENFELKHKFDDRTR